MRRRATASHWELQERSASVPGRCSPIPGRAHQARWTVRPWNRCGLELPGGGGCPRTLVVHRSVPGLSAVVHPGHDLRGPPPAAARSCRADRPRHSGFLRPVERRERGRGASHWEAPLPRSGCSLWRGFRRGAGRVAGLWPRTRRAAVPSRRRRHMPAPGPGWAAADCFRVLFRVFPVPCARGRNPSADARTDCVEEFPETSRPRGRTRTPGFQGWFSPRAPGACWGWLSRGHPRRHPDSTGVPGGGIRCAPPADTARAGRQ